MMDHESWMKHALTVAQKGLDRGEVPVGCVMVFEGEVLAEGHNEVNATLNATRHAEIVAYDNLLGYCQAKKLNVKDICSKLTLYVTVEPCVMCACALRLTGINHVVYGCDNDRFGGCGSVLDVHTKPLSISNTAKQDHQELQPETVPSTSETLPSRSKTMDGQVTNVLPTLIITSGVLKLEAISLLQKFYEGSNPKVQPT
ncbi:tRNA-specific adenosine deaminase 2-like [Dysidea avara]|uniref:tRNA-specific adenosine deaminase 2-like n=1 Tax=Dysidea avara TaxID=196820 RepID=UPI003320C7D9